MYENTKILICANNNEGKNNFAESATSVRNTMHQNASFQNYTSFQNSYTISNLLYTKLSINFFQIIFSILSLPIS